MVKGIGGEVTWCAYPKRGRGNERLGVKRKERWN